MPAQTYVDLDGLTGDFRRVQAPTTSAGAADAYKVFATGPDGKFDASVIPSGDATIEMIMATEAIPNNSFVNIYNVSGSRRIQLADAAVTTKPANGFVAVGVSSGVEAAVQLAGMVSASLTGFVAADLGKTVFLSDTTKGGITKTPPTTVGRVLFVVGYVVEVGASALRVRFEPSLRCIL